MMLTPSAFLNRRDDGFALSLALAEQLGTVRAECPRHPDGTVPPSSGTRTCRVLLFPSGQPCGWRLLPIAPPYAVDLGLVAEVLGQLGGSWEPIPGTEDAPLMVRVIVPGGPPEGVRGPVDGPDAAARLICDRLIVTLQRKQGDSQYSGRSPTAGRWPPGAPLRVPFVYAFSGFTS